MPDARPILGIAGCGWVTQNCYAPHLAGAAARFRAGPLFDTDKGRVGQACRQIGGWPADDLASLLGACDALLIATPNALHFDQAREAIAAGRPVLIEKPACIQVAQAMILAEAAGQAGVGVMAADPTCRRRDIAWLLRHAGEIGVIDRIELAWHRRSGAPAKNWHHADAGGWTGVFPDLGVHLVDIAGALLGYPQDFVELVSAKWERSAVVSTAGWHGVSKSIPSEVPSAAQLEFVQAGVTVRIAVSWQSLEPGDRTTIRAFGSNGQIEFDGLIGCSNDHALNHAHTRHLDRSGNFVRAARFPVCPDEHVMAFAKLLGAFEQVTIGADSDRFRRQAAFVAAFCEQATLSAECCQV
ncbi:Gfo/Idh/MocA family oxidoreductase [Sphingomonas sp. DG1-23]|uniref:Gfo/Idh/MocA family protein n=1 Tax=Sphingomonas sp. DG1-23 TaxID=3068316 RepID=UPI00273DF237|nr:Gfo/Idh/MocA family oxidoreductase [Sphingomonas sp. DG1-23]MDP5278685.1 Gfo/Idh/MocA family oxidoreductase [Sphingomonas sp. DG1-23]